MHLPGFVFHPNLHVKRNRKERKNRQKEEKPVVKPPKIAKNTKFNQGIVGQFKQRRGYVKIKIKELA